MWFSLLFLLESQWVPRNVSSTLKSMRANTLFHTFNLPHLQHAVLAINAIQNLEVKKIFSFSQWSSRVKFPILREPSPTSFFDTLRIWLHRFVNLGKTWGLITGLLICINLSWIFGFTLSSSGPLSLTGNYIVYHRGFPPGNIHKYPDVAGFFVLIEDSFLGY